ncbi:hypothetical protein GH714_011816 [Hevea brasiliensis]|uniref:CUE domain-containing protein n=1 Tax=Hevea brasiliensis TaxID=3981 RepID=A0A6A6NGM8_HEVBR|nr:hypothetical protein GH714_011816 [Hevea brasiliensis]
MNAIASPPCAKNSQREVSPQVGLPLASNSVRNVVFNFNKLAVILSHPCQPLASPLFVVKTSRTIMVFLLVTVLEEKDLNFVFNRLKELHSWADENLIEDIMASVNNDIDKATTLLEEMISTGNSMEKGEAKDLSNCDDFQCAEGGKKIASLGQTSNLAGDMADLSSTLEGTSKGNHKQLMDVHTACGHRLSKAAAAYKKPIQGHLSSLPVEPEWEE